MTRKKSPGCVAVLALLLSFATFWYTALVERHDLRVAVINPSDTTRTPPREVKVAFTNLGNVDEVVIGASFATQFLDQPADPIGWPIYHEPFSLAAGEARIIAVDPPQVAVIAGRVVTRAQESAESKELGTKISQRTEVRVYVLHPRLGPDTTTVPLGIYDYQAGEVTFEGVQQGYTKVLKYWVPFKLP